MIRTKIDDGAVTRPKIRDEAVTKAKLASDAQPLLATVTANCGGLDRGSGAVQVNLTFPARCDVRFDRTVRHCTPVVSPASQTNIGFLDASTREDGPLVNDDQVAITYYDTDGAPKTANRTAFQLVVHC